MAIAKQTLPELIQEEVHIYSDKPNILNRATLQLTVKTIRKLNPTLALNVQNQMGQVPIELNERVALNEPEGNCNRAAEYFNITLSSDDIKQLLETLSRQLEKTVSQHCKSHGNYILVKSLLHDWLRIAEHIIINELSNIEIKKA